MLSLILQRVHEGRGAVCLPSRFTFSRARQACIRLACLRLACLGLVAIATLALCGCAPVKPPILEPRAAAAPTGLAYATVASVRPIRAFAGLGIDPQTAILTAMSASQAGAAASGSSSEIVVRMDGGETLSVVQPDSADLAPGERVIVVPGGLTRLAPVPPPS